MRNICLLVLVVSLLSQDWVQGRFINIEDSDGQHIVGHLYLLDSSTGNWQRLKRQHVVSPQEDIQSLRLDLSSVNIVIDMDLIEGSVWDSTSGAWLRHGEHTETIVPAAGPKCHFSGPLRLSDGYASFSFCNGVNGIIHTSNESYTIEHVADSTYGSRANDTDDVFPPLLVRIISAEDIESIPIGDTDLDSVEELEAEDEEVLDDGDDYPKTTDLPSVKETTQSDKNDSHSTTPKTEAAPLLFLHLDVGEELVCSNDPKNYADGSTTTGRGKATVEVGIYINANCTDILKGMNISTATQIVDWVVNRWNIIRHVYQNTSRIGAEVDIKIKRLEIWSKNPDYYRNSHDNIEAHVRAFCSHSPEDGMDHKMLYTWEARRGVVGKAFHSGVCKAKSKCSIVIPRSNSVQRELHEFGHNLAFHHDTQMLNCKWPYGFMGWQDVTEFKDCYRPVLLASLAKRSSDCLYSFSNLTGQVFARNEQFELVPADQSLSNILDKW